MLSEDMSSNAYGEIGRYGDIVEYIKECWNQYKVIGTENILLHCSTAIGKRCI